MIFHFRNNVIFTLFLLFIPLSALSNQLDENSATHNIKLLILGDSLSAAYGLNQQQGWVSLLQKRWRDEGLSIEIVNAAVSGETTDGGLSRLPRLLEQHSPTHILIELGGNDALQGHNITKIRNNLSKLISVAKASGSTVYLQEMQIPTNYGKRYTQMFTGNYTALAQQHKVTKIPFFLQEIALNNKLMQSDGIHPNAEAQPIIANYMFEQLTPLIVSQNK